MSLTLSTILAVSDNAAGATSEHAAAAEEHHDETPFFIMGAILVAFAVAISILGFKKPDFPGSSGAARGVMALSVALVAATAFSIVYVSA